MKLRLVIFLIAILSAHYFSGQQKEICSFKLEIDEAENLDIYSMLVDHEDVLYLGTDQGLFCYRSSALRLISPAAEQKGLSVFQLQMDPEGNIYCCNLSGQILQVNQGGLELVYEVDQNKIRSIFLFHALGSNEFIYSSKNVALIKGDKEISLLEADVIHEGFEWDVFQEYEDGSFFLSSIGCGYGLQINGEQIDTVDLSFLFEDNAYPLTNCFKQEDHQMFFTSNGRSASSNVVTIDIRSRKAEKYYSVNDSLVIAMDRTNGARLIHIGGEKIFEEGNVLPNTFISTCYYHNSVLYLGTFNQGVYVCPNMEAIKHAGIPNGTGLETIGDHKIVVANTGQVFDITDTLTQIDESQINLDEVFFQNSIKAIDTLLYNKTDFYGYGIIKDLWKIEGGFFFTSSKGLYLLGSGILDVTSGDWNTDYHDGFHVTHLGENHRYHSIAASENVDQIIYSDPQGTYLLSDDLKVGKHLSYEEDNFISNDLEWYEGQWICGTAHHGILIFKDDVPVKKLSIEDGLYSNSIQKIQRVENELYIQSTKGIQVINLDDYEVRNIGLKDGIGEGIRDFDVEGNLLWVLQNSNLISIPKVNFKGQFELPRLYLDSIVIGGAPVEDVSQSMTYSHTQNSLDVYIDYRDLISMEGAKVYYRLEGMDQDWKVQDAQLNVISYSSLPPGDYKLMLKVAVDGVESESITYSFVIDAPYYQKWWFYVLIVILGATLALLVFRIYIKRENRKLRQLNELNASKLTAIQSQMNPHFIFNALNSIQDLVLKGDKKNSYTYITKFANLVRRTLNYSDKDLIEFSQEVKLIELYLTLEKLRFKTDFEYELNYPETEVLVPPMLVQPFIENALVHGLLHKEGLRKLDIVFELTENNMICTITDNGVGRKKAAEIKQRQRGEEHESFSVNAIKKRFEILGEYYGGEFGYDYVDLEENGESSGTKVVLKLPAIRKY